MNRITRVEIRRSSLDIPDFERDYNDDIAAGTMAYRKGSVLKRAILQVRVHDEAGNVGEYANWAPSGSWDSAVTSAKMALGRGASEREKIWRNGRRANRPSNPYGLAFLDIALWDLAGKATGQSLTQMLGGWRTEVPAYASCNNGDRTGNLSSKEDVAAFFGRLKTKGWRGFKMHSWNDGNAAEEIANVREMRRALGDEVELMLDPACVFNNLTDAIRVGRACTDEGFRWLEDPLRPMGLGAYQHKKLREAIGIPILQTEHVAGPEAKADFLLAGGTDLLRADCHYDLGITSILKTLHFGECLGVTTEFHAPSPVHRHMIAASQQDTMYEVANVSPAMDDPSPLIYTCGYSDNVDAISPRGTLPVPQGPGIGVEYDQDKIAGATVAEETLSV
ncbi:MAG: mandelate racemase/muconate lactonizing enzyme family protein [Rhodobacteraceae bacterium]|nr:mandelate racemase/muconate lactonizing enzyme family protein [Paracoccaceae bacterium]